MRYVCEAMTGGGSSYEVIDTAAHPRHLMCRAHQRDAIVIAEALNLYSASMPPLPLRPHMAVRDSKRCTGR